MGVTVHFEGQLSSIGEFDTVINIAKNFAESNSLEYYIFNETNKLLERVKDDQDWNYEGPTKGIQIQPSINCEPLILEFDNILFIQEYCKTQFSDISIHVLIIDLLRKIEPYFKNLVVFDEGEFWETNDIVLLQQHLDHCFEALENNKKEDTTLDGPYRLSNGRIVDLMHNK